MPGQLPAAEAQPHWHQGLATVPCAELHFHCRGSQETPTHEGLRGSDRMLGGQEARMIQVAGPDEMAWLWDSTRYLVL